MRVLAAITIVVILSVSSGCKLRPDTQSSELNDADGNEIKPLWASEFDGTDTCDLPAELFDALSLGDVCIINGQLKLLDNRGFLIITDTPVSDGRFNMELVGFTGQEFWLSARNKALRNRFDDEAVFFGCASGHNNDGPEDRDTSCYVSYSFSDVGGGQHQESVKLFSGKMIDLIKPKGSSLPVSLEIRDDQILYQFGALKGSTAFDAAKVAFEGYFGVYVVAEDSRFHFGIDSAKIFD